jgi:hypothetical protein
MWGCLGGTALRAILHGNMDAVEQVARAHNGILGVACAMDLDAHLSAAIGRPMPILWAEFQVPRRTDDGKEERHLLRERYDE